MLGIPVVDTASLTIRLIKFGVFVTFASLFFGYMDVGVSILISFFNSSFGGLGDVASINLGCVSSKLGLVSFLNSLLVQFYVVAGLVISAIGSLLTTKYVLLFFSFLMRI
ncbi:MAG: Unknown protein [uncultured Sulfurovum sp.]|uniref:Uncharacterized protein n=1 Tax=uncultured Sulfurovum sp. TaxID=269237 RepID=A0A6S6SAZ6_9BACT|nr:MAG: Unknown protein [uncultured Sulfurovum sp.]